MRTVRPRTDEKQSRVTIRRTGERDQIPLSSLGSSSGGGGVEEVEEPPEGGRKGSEAGGGFEGASGLRLRVGLFETRACWTFFLVDETRGKR